MIAPPRDRLRDWLAAHLPDATDLEISEPRAPSSTAGFSHQTLLLDASWKEAGREVGRGLVVRMLTDEHRLFPDADLRREYDAMEQLSRTGQVPVPRCYGFEDDASILEQRFYVIERVDGLIPPDRPPYAIEGWLLDAPADQQRSVWWSGIEALAAVHTVPLEVLGLGWKAETTNERVQALDAYRAWVLEDRSHDDFDAALAWLRANQPPEAQPAFCWGDARLANVVCREHRVAALLDWEMASVGDPEVDLAWWIYFDRLFSDGLGMPRLPGFPSYEQTAVRYTEHSGRETQHLGFWQVYAGARFALILIRLCQLLSPTGELPLGPDFERDNFSITFLRRVLEEHA